MNKLESKYLHLVLDEPIYVLEDHFEPDSEVIKLDKPITPEFKGDNKKGILIVFDGTTALESEEDLAFLFKGLNALNITLEDVALAYSGQIGDLEIFPHKKRITFFSEVAPNLVYEPALIGSISVLSCQELSVIGNDQNLKRKFWEGLKLLFNA